MSKAISHAASDSRTAGSDNSLSLQLALVAVGIVMVVILAFAAHTIPYFDFDLTITRAVQSLPEGAQMLLRAIGWPGYPPQVYFWMIPIPIILWFTGNRWAAVVFLIGALGIGLVGLAIKYPVDRPRPLPNLVRVDTPNLENGRNSFPAGHVQVYLATLGFLGYLILRLRKHAWWQYALLVLFGILITLIGVARISSGEHWFSDVLGAYLVGAICLWFLIRLYEWGEDRFFTDKGNYEKK